MRLQRGIAGAGLVLALLTGCTEESEPEAAPPASPSESASASPSPSPKAPPPPSMPPRAGADSDSGATAFVRYYVALVNHAAATGEVGRLRAVAQECADCQSIADLIERTLRAGGSIAPKQIWRLESVEAVSGADVVLANVREPAIIRVPEDGAKPVKTTGGLIRFEFHLKHQAAHWVVKKLVRT